MKKRRRPKNAASMTLNAWKDNPGSVTKEQASEAGARLVKRFHEKYGDEGMSRLGKLGSRAFWSKYTPTERRIEMLRRQYVARTRKKARIAAAIAAAQGRKPTGGSR